MRLKRKELRVIIENYLYEQEKEETATELSLDADVTIDDVVYDIKIEQEAEGADIKINISRDGSEVQYTYDMLIGFLKSLLDETLDGPQKNDDKLRRQVLKAMLSVDEKLVGDVDATGQMSKNKDLINKITSNRFYRNSVDDLKRSLQFKNELK